jgi:hypothetical protein
MDATSMSELESLDELTRVLLPVAGDPREIACLYSLLREFCHTFRNRLNGLKLGLYLAECKSTTGGPFAELTRRYAEVEQFVDRVQAICRPLRLTPMPLTLGTILAERRASWTDCLAARGRTLEFAPPREESRAVLDGVLLAHALDSLVAWRAEEGGEDEPVRLAWHSGSGQIDLTWDEPRTRPCRPRRDSVPTLALPLLARVASAHGGHLVVSDDDGFRVEVLLPAEFDPQSEWASDRDSPLEGASPEARECEPPDAADVSQASHRNGHARG